MDVKMFESNDVLGACYLPSVNFIIYDPLLKQADPELFKKVIAHELKHRDYKWNVFGHLWLDFKDRNVMACDGGFKYFVMKRDNVWTLSLYAELDFWVGIIYNGFHSFIDILALPLFLYRKRQWRNKNKHEIREHWE